MVLDAELLSVTSCTARVRGHLLNLAGHQSQTGKNKCILTPQAASLHSLPQELVGDRQDHQVQNADRKIHQQQAQK